MSADVGLMCFEELTDRANLAQVYGACVMVDEPEQENEVIAGQGEADKYPRALQKVF